MQQAAKHDAAVGLACKAARQGPKEVKTASLPDWAVAKQLEKKMGIITSPPAASLLEVRLAKWNQT